MRKHLDLRLQRIKTIGDRVPDLGIAGKFRFIGGFPHCGVSIGGQIAHFRKSQFFAAVFRFERRRQGLIEIFPHIAAGKIEFGRQFLELRCEAMGSLFGDTFKHIAIGLKAEFSSQFMGIFMKSLHRLTEDNGSFPVVCELSVEPGHF